MKPEVSTKSTKNEILSAYEDLMKTVQEKKSEEPKKIQERQKQETIVKQAEGLSYENIVNDMARLKSDLSSALDKLGENFVSEFKKFEELQHAIQIEKKNLEDLYQLSVNTDSLAVMLLAQREKKEQFEQEMAARKAELDGKISSEKERFEDDLAEKKLQWKKEQEAYAIKLKEEAEETRKNKAREEEEYQYNLKLTRKKEADVYEEKKQKLEKELVEKRISFEKEFAEREAGVKAVETELKDLRAKNQSFPSELEQAVAIALKNTTEKLQAEFAFSKELKAKEVEGELKLRDQTIETLKAKIKDMEVMFKEMAQKTSTAEASVKDIAIKAIESTSKLHIVEKAKDSIA
ncbi:MAG: hypothetical protein U1C46_06575 [Bacteroidales bacterium]|nr:hypothetical protein [Bacteroidales bacterium]MDZ4204467.1 hypothetical protein [Bacteroidales bacterium]